MSRRRSWGFGEKKERWSVRKNGEQIFVISHNNMFSMYPVDIIDTANKTDENNKLANYIKIDIE